MTTTLVLLSDLRMEIAATDRQDFREALKKREEFIRKLLATLPRARRLTCPDGMS